MIAFRSLAAAYALSLVPVLGAPYISEILASNDKGLKDETGSREDWIEIRNPDATPIDLKGWYLSDSSNNRTKWRFPAVIIPANGHLLVFASNKNLAVPGQPLHTNFALSAGGEYLGLTQPDGVTTVSEFAPSFPQQYADISYGIPLDTATHTLVEPNAMVKWQVPTSATNPASNWFTPGFSDSSWPTAFQGIGFDRTPEGINFAPEIGSNGNVESWIYGNNSTQSCYVRIPFAAPAGVTSLKLRVKYDDGFVAWINGQPLLSGNSQLRRNAPASLAWNSRATQINNDDVAIQYAEFDVTASIPSLVAGDNLLAFHLLNESPTSRDLLLRVELVATLASTPSEFTAGYFATPTPGTANGGVDSLVIPRQVTFSKSQGTITQNFSLTLGGAQAGEQIRYTLDGSAPTASSPLYSSPLTISNSTLVRARLYHPTSGRLGLLSSAHYERLEPSLTNYKSSGQPFRSALPILILNNLNHSGEFPNDDVKRSIRLNLFDRDSSGYASMVGTPTLSTPATAAIRGSSSAGFNKKPYSIEFTDESGGGTDVTILGMKGEDFALVSCYDFDRTFMRNAWIYEVARQAGYWAPRTRLVEVFFNQNNNNLSYESATAADYRGVYVLTEVVRRDGDRVDITKIESSDSTLPEVSGGYILKVDRKDPDEFSWFTSRRLPTGNEGMVIHRPKLADLTTAQTDYLKAYVQRFEDSLFNEQAAGFPTRNYQKYIEPRSWVDHHLFNMYPKNVDGLRLSAYFHKDRGRPIEGGSLWDFDRSADNNQSGDNRDADTTQWNGTGDATRYFELDWWGRLFQDIEFRQLYVDRWHALRRGPLATANINHILTEFYQEFRSEVDSADNPARRDYAKWYGGNGSLLNYTNHLKNWLSARANWVESQFAAPTSHSLPAGPVTVGSSASISIPPNTRVFYTLDGSDPRSAGGAIAVDAMEYTGGSIPLTQTTLLTSRAYRSGNYAIPATNWSGPLQSLYTVDEPFASQANLLVTAIHFNPAAPSEVAKNSLLEVDASDFSWIELRNNSAGPINLEGLSLVKSRPVSAVTLAARTLAPGEKVLLVKNRAAFTFRYGSGAATKIAAEWPGDKRLGLLEGDMRLIARDGSSVIANFTWQTSWIGAAAGAGHAMEYTSKLATTAAYQTPSHWRPSTTPGGSPGEMAPEGYAAWQLSVFPGETENTGTLDDFDHDGIANLIEYLLGTDPRTHTPGPGTLEPLEDGGFALDYTCRADRTDATLSVWQSNGLDLWIPAERDLLIRTEGDLYYRRAYFPAGGKGFLRFKAVAP
jgi:hypothetical protein